MRVWSLGGGLARKLLSTSPTRDPDYRESDHYEAVPDNNNNSEASCSATHKLSSWQGEFIGVIRRFIDYGGPG